VRRSRVLALVVAGACALASGCTGGGSPPGVPAHVSVSGSAPVAAGSPSPSTPRARSFTLVATGDVLLHPPLWAQARADAAHTGRAPMDYAPMLAAVKPYVSGADLAICHLETPLAAPGGPFAGYPLFSAPPQVVPALAATGYDVCSTASNHTFDQGAAGIRRTLDDLDAAGIAHAGSARTPAEAARTTIVDANGVRVAFLSFAYGFNGVPYPGGDRWRANIIDVPAILAAARTARERGAQVVVVAMHWGAEYHQEPSAQQLEPAPELARSPDIDLVISHHAHVVEPIQKIGHTWVVYGLGNLIAAHSTPGPTNQEGLLVRFTFTQGPGGRFSVTRAEYEPLLVAPASPIRVLDVPVALATHAYGSTTRARLEQALARTIQVVDSRGAVQAGLVPIR